VQLSEVQFILKWGGELTPLGEAQAKTLGEKFRNSLYPGEADGVLRLHATYRGVPFITFLIWQVCCDCTPPTDMTSRSIQAMRAGCRYAPRLHLTCASPAPPLHLLCVSLYLPLSPSISLYFPWQMTAAAFTKGFLDLEGQVPTARSRFA
jgi:hypothetical protein